MKLCLRSDSRGLSVQVDERSMHAGGNCGSSVGEKIPLYTIFLSLSYKTPNKMMTHALGEKLHKNAQDRTPPLPLWRCPLGVCHEATPNRNPCATVEIGANCITTVLTVIDQPDVEREKQGAQHPKRFVGRFPNQQAEQKPGRDHA